MFTIYVRKGKISIYEVECEKITPTEDPSVLWLQAGEYKARILSPSLFHEKIGAGDSAKVVPMIYCSHALYSDLEAAKACVEKDIRYDATTFQIRKEREPKSEEEIQAALSAVEIIML